MAGEPERVVRDYFGALTRRGLDAARGYLAPQLRGTMHGLAEFARAGEVMDYFAALFASAPDFTFEVRRRVTEGDEVAGFRVVEIPGHAPGHIALVRDGLALTADAFDVVDVATGRPRPPGLPETAFNQDEAEARESVREVAALDLREAWPGHGEPLRGDVRGQLERVR